MEHDQQVSTGTDLVELDPGDSWQGSWGLRAGSAT